MGDTKSKKASRNAFVVRPIEADPNGYDILESEDIEFGTRLFDNEDGAKKYAEELISKGIKRFKTREAIMPYTVNVEVYDVGGKITQTMSCEAEPEEVVKPAWA